jgi:hypothetical protein
MSEQSPDFCSYVFGANDHPDGHAFITLEPSGQGLKVLGKGALFLKLRFGIDIKQAEALATQLNELVDGIEYGR